LGTGTVKSLRTALLYLVNGAVLLIVGAVAYILAVSEQTAAAMRGRRGIAALFDPLRALFTYQGLMAFLVVLALATIGAYWIHRREKREVEVYNARRGDQNTTARDR